MKPFKCSNEEDTELKSLIFYNSEPFFKKKTPRH